MIYACFLIMKILITGATGFIGANLVRYFSRNGHSVLALGRRKKPPVDLRKYADYICADIASPMQSIDCDTVIHTAALADDRSEFTLLKKTNVDGTKNVFEATKNARLFIHISSASVYQSDGAINLECKTINQKKLSLYGQSKLLAEKYLHKKKTVNMGIYILRPRAVYGIGDRALLPRILNLPKKEKVFFPGNKDVGASMTHIDNLRYAIELVIAKKQTGTHTYNVADGKTYQLRTVIKELLENSFNKNWNYKNIPVPILHMLVTAFEMAGIRSNLTKQAIDYFSKPNILDIQKIKKELGYEPITDFEKEKEKLFGWIKKTGIKTFINSPAALSWQV